MDDRIISETALSESIHELEKQMLSQKRNDSGDLISRQDAIRKFTFGYDGKRIPETDIDNFPTQISFRDVKKILRELPSAQKTGHWIDKYNNGNRYCDQCGAVLEGDNWYWRNNYFCYHCGAKMVGEQDD